MGSGVAKANPIPTMVKEEEVFSMRVDQKRGWKVD